MSLKWFLGMLMPGDLGITQTVNAIREAVAFSIRRPEVRRQAELIVAGLAEKDELAEIRAIFDWVLSHYRFLSDIAGIETVKSPEVSVSEIQERGQFQGDCDDAVALLAALLKSIGYTVRAVTISIPGKGRQFRHIYLKVWLPRVRRWESMELTARKRPMGWQAQSERLKTYPL